MMRWSLISILHSTFLPSRLPSIPNETTSFYFTSPKKYMDLRNKQKEMCFHLLKIKPISTLKALKALKCKSFFPFLDFYYSSPLTHSNAQLEMSISNPCKADKQKLRDRGTGGHREGPNIRCFVAKSGLSRFTRFLGVRFSAFDSNKYCQIGQWCYYYWFDIDSQSVLLIANLFYR